MTTIQVFIDAMFFLTVGEVWPDGDAPDEVTAEAVIEAMRRSGSVRSMLHDWNMEPDEVNVVVDGKSVRWIEGS